MAARCRQEEWTSAAQMNYYPEFAELLDQALTAHDRSGAWLAQRLGVNPATVTRWRNGDSRPNQPEVVIQVADLLGIQDEDRRRLLHAAGYGVGGAPPTALRHTADPLGKPANDERSAADPWLAYPATYRQVTMTTLAYWCAMGASGLVLGLAGSGVSSLLRYFVRRPDRAASYLPVRQYALLPIWVELQPMVEPPPVILYRLLLRGILEATAQHASQLPPDLRQMGQDHLYHDDALVLQTTLFAVLAHYQAIQVKLVLVIDRIDLLVGNSQRLLGDSLRALRDRFRTTVIYLVGMRITPTYLDTIAALGDWGRLLSTHLCVVGGLSAQDSAFVIAHHTQAAQHQPTAADIAQFLALSGGYPTLLKAVVHWWLTHTPRLPSVEWGEALRQEPGIQLRLREIGRGLSVQEREVLQRVITNPGTSAIPHAVGERLVQLGICRQHPQGGWELAGLLFAGIV